MITLEIEVRRCNYVKARSYNDLWMILSTSRGTCKGCGTWEPKPGEKLEIVGEWKVYQGQKEFSFVSMKVALPKDSRSLLHYICETTSGFGEALEGRIWDRHGADWETLERFDVVGVSDAKMESFRQSKEYLARNQKECETMAWLIAKGLTINQAKKAIEEWKDKAIPKIEENCYNLTEISGIGFLRVDNDIRQQFGIADDDDRRIEAGVVYALQEYLQGSTVCHWRDLTIQIINTTLRDLDRQKVVKVIAKMLADGKLIPFEATNMIALKKDYEAEKTIWEYVQNN